MPEFWVNTDGLAGSADGFDDAADRVRDVHSTYTASTGELGEPWGTGSAGKTFAQGFVPSAQLYTEGLQTWENALRQTADGVSAMADNFRRTEDNNVQIANQLMPPPGGSGS